MSVSTFDSLVDRLFSYLTCAQLTTRLALTSNGGYAAVERYAERVQQHFEAEVDDADTAAAVSLQGSEQAVVTTAASADASSMTAPAATGGVPCTMRQQSDVLKIDSPEVLSQMLKAPLRSLGTSIQLNFFPDHHILSAISRGLPYLRRLQCALKVGEVESPIFPLGVRELILTITCDERDEAKSSWFLPQCIIAAAQSKSLESLSITWFSSVFMLVPKNFLRPLTNLAQFQHLTLQHVSASGLNDWLDDIRCLRSLRTFKCPDANYDFYTALLADGFQAPLEEFDMKRMDMEEDEELMTMCIQLKDHLISITPDE